MKTRMIQTHKIQNLTYEYEIVFYLCFVVGRMVDEFIYLSKVSGLETQDRYYHNI